MKRRACCMTHIMIKLVHPHLLACLLSLDHAKDVPLVIAYYRVQIALHPAAR